MKQLAIRANTLADYLVVVVLSLVPLYAFITVWCSSLIGHYTILRLWDDLLLAVLIIICCWWLTKDSRLRNWFTSSLLVRLIATYVIVTFLLGLVSWAKGEVTPKALAYGLLVNLRFMLWFLAVLLTARRSALLRRIWPWILLVPASIVILFGILQFTVLPHNFLSHFGYSAATTIAPIETINHNSNYIRVQSTLRGANPLGAYLIIVISALAALLVRGVRRPLYYILFGVAALGALYASGSRGAWIGTIISLGVVVWMRLEAPRNRLLFGGTCLALAVLAVGGYLIFKNNIGLQNEVLHTQANSAVAITSNGAHASALKNGLKDVSHQPLGDGPGTAGPASVYNSKHAARIAEDYYVQVAQETGWLGLTLFLSIITLVGIELYEQTGTSQLSRIVLASFAGIVFVNLLSHAWTDDTLAYIWWGMAAIVLARRAEEAL